MHVMVLTHCKEHFHTPWCDASKEFCYACGIAGLSFSVITSKLLGVVFVMISCILIKNKSALIMT